MAEKKKRVQLPPQITKIMVMDRRTGRQVPRYQVTLDTGINPKTGNRSQSRRRYATEKEARDALASTQTTVAQGTYVHKNTRTLKIAVSEWLGGQHGLRDATVAQYTNVLKPVVARHGDVLVQKLEKSHLDQLVKDLQAGGLPKGEDGVTRPWGPRSVNLSMRVLAMVLDDEKAQGRVGQNVARLVKAVPGNRHEMKTFTEKEAAKLLMATANDRVGHAWHLALSGLRRGEVCGLRWDDIDFENDRLTITNNRVLVGNEAKDGPPKSEGSNRVLPLTAGLRAALKQARKMQLAERLALGEAYGSGKYVVSDEAGHPIRPDTLSAMWERTTKASGLPKIRLHDARHTCATLMHLQGVPIAVISAWIGHSSPAFTMRVYAHSQDDALQAAADSLAGLVTPRDTEGLA